MKVNVKKSKPVGYVPKTITITLENVQDEIMFKHVIGCWENPENCYCVAEVREFAKKLFNSPGVKELQI